MKIKEKVLKELENTKGDSLKVILNNTIDLTLAEALKVIDEIGKREGKRYEKEQKKCFKNAYNPEKDGWNPEHFNRCDGDITAGRLDILEELKQKIKK